MTVTRQLRIFGRVQGVGYRVALLRAARRVGLTGWVRNRSDGSVEALIQGDGESVENMLTWCRRGPPEAGVERVEVDAGVEPGSGTYREFSLLDTL